MYENGYNSTFEIKKIVNELKSKQPIAILLFSNIDGKGERIHVFIEDPAGRMQIPRRLLVQLGAGTIAYMDYTPKNHIVSYSGKLILTFTKHMPIQKHENIHLTYTGINKKNVQPSHQTEFLHVRTTTRRAGATYSLQVLARLQASA